MRQKPTGSNLDKSGSNIPRAGSQRKGSQTRGDPHDDDIMNLNVAQARPVNFTSSNNALKVTEDPRAGFEAYDFPERVPFSSQI